MRISEPNPDIMHIESLRREFVREFDRETLENLTLEQYALRTGDKSNFCYRLEREQIGMGDISAATAKKFGVWIRMVTGEYDYTKKYGETVERAFETIRSEICHLVDAGAENDYDAIRKNMIAATVRYKILAMYYPNRFLAILSKQHLSYFCSKAGLVCLEDDDELMLQRKLLIWKDSHEEMRDWSLLKYAAYLYEHFGHPPKEEKKKSAKKKSPLKILEDDLKKFDRQHPKTQLTEVEVRQRSALVANIAKKRAAGVCQLCGMPAPFFNQKGEAYLESHHVVWLARGGADDIQNTVALCPNCHRKMHVLDETKDVEYLMKIISN